LVPQQRCVDEHSGRQLFGTVESSRGPASTPGPGVHTPPPQVPLQTFPQAPQWFTSIWVKTQRPSQQTCVLAHGSGQPPAPLPAHPATLTKPMQTAKTNRLDITDPSRSSRPTKTRVSLDATASAVNGLAPPR
jgi:hypothetical protein